MPLLNVLFLQRLVAAAVASVTLLILSSSLFSARQQSSLSVLSDQDTTPYCYSDLTDRTPRSCQTLSVSVGNDGRP